MNKLLKQWPRWLGFSAIVFLISAGMLAILESTTGFGWSSASLTGAAIGSFIWPAITIIKEES